MPLKLNGPVQQPAIKMYQRQKTLTAKSLPSHQMALSLRSCTELAVCDSNVLMQVDTDVVCHQLHSITVTLVEWNTRATHSLTRWQFSCSINAIIHKQDSNNQCYEFSFTNIWKLETKLIHTQSYWIIDISSKTQVKCKKVCTENLATFIEVNITN